ncbi:caspase recruitment domain-containing protein 8 isoform X14 [Macaca mulatta]|uniref:uncharacterized protein LOC718594 isoform X2 n=1 Tax=Macaca mulatta TaxID=9544 RepID=UPI0010A226ED|nr:uncharacterized protein LOC718594 isoform X2 [Macaca mulatta]XP_028694415.1 uncharacterized protein LOC718594 isoform X2 [Macaca mulatta]
MDKKECHEESSSSDEELWRRDNGSSRSVDASELVRQQTVLVDNSIQKLRDTRTGIFSQAEACVTDDMVYRELPPVSQMCGSILHFFDEDDETEAEALWFTAFPKYQPSGEDIPRFQTTNVKPLMRELGGHVQKSLILLSPHRYNRHK